MKVQLEQPAIEIKEQDKVYLPVQAQRSIGKTIVQKQIE
jgi:hypothetical protein